MSFTFLNNLFSELTPTAENHGHSMETGALDDSSKMVVETVGGRRDRHTKADRDKANQIRNDQLKLGDVFAHAYDSLVQAVQQPSAIGLVTMMTSDKLKAQSKLKGKSFLLRKNTILRGKKNQKAKKGTVSKKVIRAKGLYAVKDVTFDDAKHLNRLWEEYVLKLIPEQRDRGGKEDQTRFMCLIRADYHGAWIKIIASRNSTDVGHEGIVIKETLKTLQVCTEENGVKMFLKENIIFGMRIKEDWFKVLGVNIILRADDRSKFKPKWKNSVPVLKNILPVQ